MINKIVDGISKALNQEFGDEYEIYQNNVMQGLDEPCFFIAVLEPSKDQLLQNRFLQRNPFDVHCFPKRWDDNREMQEAAERMLDCLEWIIPEEPIHGTEIRWQIEDGVLHFFVSYNVVRNRMIQKDLMQEITQNITTEG